MILRKQCTGPWYSDGAVCSRTFTLRTPTRRRAQTPARASPRTHTHHTHAPRTYPAAARTRCRYYPPQTPRPGRTRNATTSPRYLPITPVKPNSRGSVLSGGWVGVWGLVRISLSSIVREFRTQRPSMRRGSATWRIGQHESMVTWRREWIDGPLLRRWSLRSSGSRSDRRRVGRVRLQRRRTQCHRSRAHSALGRNSHVDTREYVLPLLPLHPSPPSPHSLPPSPIPFPT
jgi:hypothetical protein